MTSAVYLGTAALLMWAIYRRPKPMCLVLGVAFLAAIGAAEIAHGQHIKPVLMGLDAMIVMAAWFVWTHYRSDRANIIAWLGLCKIMAGISASLSMPYLVWASINNALFVVMILVAGGFTDGIIAWLGRRIARTGTRRAGLLRYLERFE
jgi:hypothetical protein